MEVYVNSNDYQEQLEHFQIAKANQFIIARMSYGIMVLTYCGQITEDNQLFMVHYSYLLLHISYSLLFTFDS